MSRGVLADRWSHRRPRAWFEPPARVEVIERDECKAIERPVIPQVYDWAKSDPDLNQEATKGK